MSGDKTTSKDRVPAWLSAFSWSILGMIGAILTICILSSSLLWLVRWTTPGWSPGGFTRTGTPAVVTSPAASTSGTPPTAAQTTAGDTVQPLDTATPSPTPSLQSAQTPIPTASSTLTTPDNQSAADTPEAAVTAPPTPTEPSADAVDEPSDTPASSVATATRVPATPTFTLTSTPTSTPTPTATPIPLSPQEYVVQRDDWLSKLSDKFYGDILAYPAIVAATNAKAADDDSFALITDPDVIEIGQKLWIPTAEEAAALLAEAEPE